MAAHQAKGWRLTQSSIAIACRWGLRSLISGFVSLVRFKDNYAKDLTPYDHAVSRPIGNVILGLQVKLVLSHSNDIEPGVISD